MHNKVRVTQVGFVIVSVKVYAILTGGKHKLKTKSINTLRINNRFVRKKITF